MIFSDVIFGDGANVLITGDKEGPWATFVARSTDYRIQTVYYCLIYNHDNLIVLVS